MIKECDHLQTQKDWEPKLERFLHKKKPASGLVVQLINKNLKKG